MSGGVPTEDGPSPLEAPCWQRTLYSCWVGQFISIVGFAFVMPFIPFYVRELGVEGEASVALWSGLVITAAGVMQAILAPIWGALADRYGRKIMVERAMFGGAVALTAMAFAGNVWHLFALRALQGSLTGTVVACNTLVASVTPKKRMGYSLGMMEVAVLMGVTIGPLFGGLMADAWGYRVPFAAAGGMLFLGGLVVHFLAYENFCAPDGKSAQEHGLRRAFGAKGLAALLITFLMISLAGSFVGPIFPLLVEQVSETARVASIAGIMLAVSGLAAGLAAFAIGMMGDRVGHKPLLITCTLAAAASAAPHAIAQTVSQLGILQILKGISRGGTAPTLNAIVAQAVSADTYGRAFGNTRVASAAGMAAGPLLGGFTAAHLGLRWPFVILGGLLVLTAVLVAGWVQPTINEETEEERVPSRADAEAAT